MNPLTGATKLKAPPKPAVTSKSNEDANDAAALTEPIAAPRQPSATIPTGSSSVKEVDPSPSPTSNIVTLGSIAPESLSRELRSEELELPEPPSSVVTSAPEADMETPDVLVLPVEITTNTVSYESIAIVETKKLDNRDSPTSPKLEEVVGKEFLEVEISEPEHVTPRLPLPTIEETELAAVEGIDEAPLPIEDGVIDVETLQPDNTAVGTERLETGELTELVVSALDVVDQFEPEQQEEIEEELSIILELTDKVDKLLADPNLEPLVQEESIEELKESLHQHIAELFLQLGIEVRDEDTEAFARYIVRSDSRGRKLSKELNLQAPEDRGTHEAIRQWLAGLKRLQDELVASLGRWAIHLSTQSTIYQSF